MTRDPKDVYNETFAVAKEDGRTDEQAHALADEARIDMESGLIDEARNRAKEAR